MRTISCLSTVLLLSVIAGACSPATDAQFQGEVAQAGSATAGGSSAQGGMATAGSLALGGNISSSGSNDGGTGGSTIPPGEACATGTIVGKLSGVNLFVMIDRSQSMSALVSDDGASRWLVATRALAKFFADPSATGLKVALRFYPHDQPSVGCNQEACDAAACATPLVELGTLEATPAPTDTHEQALLDATNVTMPPVESEGTPTSIALDGALRWAAAQRLKTPTENSVVALVTDGEATSCDTDILNVAQLAADALAATSTRTYVVGLTGAIEADINTIAKAGGTEQGIFVADGNGAEQQLLDALSAIRGAVVDCDLPMPEPKPGQEVDPARVNVNLTTAIGKSTLPQLPNAAACADMPGWYYDNPADPANIILCPSTCDAVSTDPMSTLEILLGCLTVTDVPR
jgi:hypothetical protein